MALPDDLDGFFEDLDPDMFHFAGSAVIDEPAPECEFAEFIERSLVMLRAQFAAAGGAPNPVVFLASCERLAGFVAQDGETIAQFVGRLAVEANQLSAMRVFFYRRAPVAAVPLSSEWGLRVGVLAIDAVDAEDAELLHDGVVWYAEEIAAGERARLSGILEVSGHERLIDTRMLSSQPIGVLEPILGQFLPPWDR